MDRLKGKRTLITGGTTGIGLETARQFMAEGARVVVTGQNPETAAQAREILGPEALVLRSDAASLPDMQALAQQLKEHYGALDAVFINAGISVFKPLEQWSEADFDRLTGINFKGAFFLVQALLPLLANPASIILTSSACVHAGLPGSSVYAASKATLISLAQTLSGELVGRGIRVNALSPGVVDTPLMSKQGLPPALIETIQQELASDVPMKRVAQPVEIAKAAVFLASDESSYMLAAELVVDGGVNSV